MLAGLHATWSPQLLQQGLLQQRGPGSCACGSAFVWVKISAQQCGAVWEQRGPALSLLSASTAVLVLHGGLAVLHAQGSNRAWCAHRRW